MRAIIAVPFFNTLENRRNFAVQRTLNELRRQVQPPSVIVPVDNGSTDTRCWEWLLGEEGFLPIRIEEPMSISQGVNTAWHPFHKELEETERAVAIKFDSDMQAQDGWLEALLAAIEANRAELYQGKPLGLVGLLLQRHPNPPPADAPRGPGGLVRVQYLHGACVARTPFGFQNIGYEKHPYLPELRPPDADPSLPWGRWGWGDHWTTQRLNFCDLWLGMLVDYTVWGHFGCGSLMRAEKEAIMPVGLASLQEMVTRLGQGDIGPYQEFDGAEDPIYGAQWGAIPWN